MAERVRRAPSGLRTRTTDLGWNDLPPAAPGGEDENPWAWAAHEPEEGERVDVSRFDVTAVLVCFDAARWLPATLDGLRRLDVRPQRLVAIDNGSSDNTRALLEQAQAEGVLDAVHVGKKTFGFGQAVTAALRQDRLARTGSADTQTMERRLDEAGSPDWARDHRWLWLLHDDAVPAPDTLYRLLAHVATERGIDVTGPKLLLPRRRQSNHQLSEVGVTISGTGRRELLLDRGEIDQGQRDQPAERLGVSTCGMLVRTAVWRDLDGLDPAVPVFRDGVEFGWRAHLNGYRVVTTPDAEMTHRQVGRAGLRPRGLGGRHPGALDRLLGMTVVAGHAPARALPLVWLRLVLSCLLLAVGYLLGKAPGRSRDELAAMATFVAHPGRLRALRRRTASIDPAPGTAEVVRTLRPPWWSSLRILAETLGGALSERYASVAGEVDSASIDELTTDEFSSVSDEGSRHPWLRPGVLLLGAAVVAALVAARGLVGTGSLVAPALLPAYDSLGALWSAVWQPIPGAPGQVAPPWLAITALGSTVTLGQPEWFTTLLVCGVVPLSLLAVYPVTLRLLVDRRLRLWCAATYALLPVLLGGTNQGRLELSVFSIGLPLLVMAVRSLVLRRVRSFEAWRGGWAAGVVLVVLSAFQPAVMLLALVLGIGGAVALRRTPRKIGRIGIALGLPLVVWLPWWPTVILAPGRLLVGPDAALDGAGPAPDALGLLLGRGLGQGLPPLWVGAVVLGMVWAVALFALVRRPADRVVLAAWATAAASLLLALVASRLLVEVPPLGTEVRPWVGALLLVTFASLLLAGAVGSDGLSGEVSGRSFSWVQPAAVLAGAAVTLVALGGAAWWVWAGARGPVERASLDVLPTYVRVAMTSDAQPRVLALDLTGDRVGFSVLAGDEGASRQGDADRGFAFGGSKAARDDVTDAVSRLAAGSADADVAQRLRRLGVGYVVVRGADDEQRARIGNTPGLGTASGTGSTVVWQLDPAVSRVAVVPADPAGGDDDVPVTRAPVAVPPGTGERHLLIGEAADPRWRGELGGAPLPRVVDGWQEGFVVPAEGGTAVWRLDSVAPWLLPVQGVVLLVALVLAAPGIRRPDVRDPALSARRAATLSEVGA
ncbi:Glycosyltransferase, GT2 family [Microlunatus sagamiharensis]|uniref:Glycosyltransferase, GT2 family n=1 Tax=Microlunatus sagamiharensis TaxID=546874 RepID=A0A1H2LLI2_9ACTN|nr:glycosyltransferase [Microlunatus sagamiharensis]SDU81863.1 Glycosyltransferase, GT2 family [Microlunatus sagamiharensis]